MFLSVIIPAYNEEKRLPETLKKVKNYLGTQKYGWEVLIINDGSTDNTSGVSVGLTQGLEGFKVIDNKENKGKGAVVKQGMLEAKGEWRLLMDADNSTDISQLDKFWEFIKLNPKSEIRNPKQYLNSNKQNSKSLKNYNLENSDLFRASNFEFRAFDVIIGSRYLNKDSIKIKQPLMRRIVSRLGK